MTWRICMLIAVLLWEAGCTPPAKSRAPIPASVPTRSGLGNDTGGAFEKKRHASSPVSAARPKSAHCVVLNLSDYAWQIAVTAASGRETHAVRLLPRSSLEMDLAGGSYVIEQTMLACPAGPVRSRRFAARLEAGQTYRWRVATLLSLPAAAPIAHE